MVLWVVSSHGTSSLVHQEPEYRRIGFPNNLKILRSRYYNSQFINIYLIQTTSNHCHYLLCAIPSLGRHKWKEECSFRKAVRNIFLVFEVVLCFKNAAAFFSSILSFPSQLLQLQHGSSSQCQHQCVRWILWEWGWWHDKMGEGCREISTYPTPLCHGLQWIFLEMHQ